MKKGILFFALNLVLMQSVFAANPVAMTRTAIGWPNTSPPTEMVIEDDGAVYLSRGSLRSLKMTLAPEQIASMIQSIAQLEVSELDPSPFSWSGPWTTFQVFDQSGRPTLIAREVMGEMVYMNNGLGKELVLHLKALRELNRSLNLFTIGGGN